jgi:hypothetical protein
MERQLNMLNINTAPAPCPSPSIPLLPERVATPPQAEREAEPRSLDDRELGERVFAAIHHI